LLVRCAACEFVVGSVDAHKAPATVEIGIVDYDPGPGIVARTFRFGQGWKRFPDADGVRRMKADAARRVRLGKSPHHVHGRPDVETLGPGVWNARWGFGRVTTQEIECPNGHRAILDAGRLRVSAGDWRIHWTRPA
jgi:hypothetical protein